MERRPLLKYPCDGLFFLLNYNREEGATKLAPQGWVNQLNVIEEMGATGTNSDTPTNANWSGNTEFHALTSRLLSENWHTFIIRPYLPPIKMGKCLVPGVQLYFELFLNPNSVYLMGTPNKGSPRNFLPSIMRTSKSLC